jgi:hypothetical protein
MKQFLLTIFSFIYFGSGCKKLQENQLPDATQTGANTYGCLVNGNTWIPSGRAAGSGINATSGGFFGTPDGKRNIFIKAYSSNDYIDVYLKNIYQTGTYLLNKNTDVHPNVAYPESYGAYFVDGQDYYVTDPTHTGAVIITYADTSTGIVSGTFEMHLYQKNSGKIINITKGRFDYKTH